jgi:NADPH2 dehydrogenase
MNWPAINRFSPLRLRGNRRLGNRVVVPPMASTTADENGFVTKATLAHYARLSRSRAGLVMVEYTYVDPSGRSEANQLGIYRDDQVPGLASVARAIHRSGAVAGIQITHAGAKTTPDLTGGRVLAPSRVVVPVKDRQMPTPEPMSLEEVGQLKRAFLLAVGRAVRAGFDLVELHSAHGYGLNQWISPLTNLREDEYGGSLSRNSRLLLELVAEARAAYPELLLAARIPGQDFIEGGLTSIDMRWMARELEAAGLDIIDVSSGLGGWRRPGTRSGEGYLVSEAALIQSAVSLPVIGVGGIESGSYIDECLRSGKLSLAAVGRAILKDPGEWGRQNLLRAESVRAYFAEGACER